MKIFIPLKVIFFIFIFSFQWSSCKQTSLQDLYDEAMELHDEVMPRMGEIADLEKQALQIKFKLEKEEGEEAKQKLDKVKQLLADLDVADKGMWDWMKGFEDPREKDWTPQKKIDYFNIEIEKIRLVNTQIKTSIEDGNTIINNLK